MPKQTVEEFMQEFFAARSNEIRRELEARAPFRLKYFVADCVWDSRANAVKDSESERVLSVSNSGSKAEVITQPASPFPKLRYHLCFEGQSWFIKHVDLECPVCAQKGPNPDCPLCKGSGWHVAGNVRSQIKADLGLE